MAPIRRHPRDGAAARLMDDRNQVSSTARILHSGRENCRGIMYRFTFLFLRYPLPSSRRIGIFDNSSIGGHRGQKDRESYTIDRKGRKTTTTNRTKNRDSDEISTRPTLRKKHERTFFVACGAGRRDSRLRGYYDDLGKRQMPNDHRTFATAIISRPMASRASS